MRKQILPKPKKQSPKRAIVKQDKTRRKGQKKKYKIRNWKEYNESLVQRGSIEFWIERQKEIGHHWKIEITDETGKRKRGASSQYSDAAIELCRLVGKVFHQRLRQTEGLMGSIFSMMGVRVEVPDFSTLSRRGKKLVVSLPKRAKGRIIAVLDGSGLKVYGEGEWKVRKHGYSKRREWVKVHLSVDADGEVRAVLVTGNNVDDASAGVELLRRQRGEKIQGAYGDGAFDKEKMYRACQELEIPEIHIPPRTDAKIWVHGNRKGERHPRDENVRAIRRSTRRQWKIKSGYHQRSTVENVFYRQKTIFGDRLNSRGEENQQTEVMLMYKALNIMHHAGMPDSYAVNSS